MSAHSQTVVWEMHLGKSTPGARGYWLQRLGQWVAGRSERHTTALRMTLHRVWDSRREQFRPAQMESALEQVAARGEQSWLMTV
jgi:hypothetical protein